MSEDYAFTIKVSNYVKYGEPTIATYQPLLKEWQKLKCIIDTVQYEEDSKGKLHAHGIVRVPVKMFRKKLIQPGMHIKLKLIFDRDGWIEYIIKDQTKTYLKGFPSDPDDLSSDADYSGADPAACCLPKVGKRLFII